MRLRSLVVFAAFCCLAPSGGAPPPTAPTTFTNPLVAGRALADPWIAQKNGWYYFTFTAGRSIEIWKGRTISGLADTAKVTVWRAPDTGPNVHDVWAPELHFVQGKWYVYYTATDAARSDLNRRVFVLEAQTGDPQGAYQDRGQLSIPGADVYAIDGTVYERKRDGALFFLWSGRAENKPGPQNLYIAPLKNPWTIAGPRVLISAPTLPWEKHGWAVNEGPEVLERKSKTFVVYSASGGTTPFYCLGLLSNTSGDLLDPKAWRKSPAPVFSQYAGPDGAVYGPGHNGFFRSPDGREDWIVYHGKQTPANTWGGRLVRAQRFFWNRDESPCFGHPVPAGVALAVPGGEAVTAQAPRGSGTGLRATYFARPDLSDPRETRVDPAVNFDWRENAPSERLPADGFSIRWRGQIEPRYSDTYTLQTFADDGVRVWIDDKLLIDNWAEQPATARQGSVALTAGRRHALRIDYYDHKNEARLHLAWSSPRQPFEIVPTSQLHPSP